MGAELVVVVDAGSLIQRYEANGGEVRVDLIWCRPTWYISAVLCSVRKRKLCMFFQMSYRPANSHNISYSEFISKSPVGAGFTKQRSDIDRAVKHWKGLINITTIPYLPCYMFRRHSYVWLHPLGSEYNQILLVTSGN